jgi:hypothetical protein
MSKSPWITDFFLAPSFVNIGLQTWLLLKSILSDFFLGGKSDTCLNVSLHHFIIRPDFRRTILLEVLRIIKCHPTMGPLPHIHKGKNKASQLKEFKLFSSRASYTCLAVREPGNTRHHSQKLFTDHSWGGSQGHSRCQNCTKYSPYLSRVSSYQSKLYFGQDILHLVLLDIGHMTSNLVIFQIFALPLVIGLGIARYRYGCVAW